MKKINTVEISGQISDSKITINQNQDGNQKFSESHIIYEVDESSYKVTPLESFHKSKSIFASTIIISSISIAADICGLASFYINYPRGISLLILSPICIYFAISTKHNRWLMKLPQNGASFFQKDKWYEKLPDGSVASYIKTAKCGYPKCLGTIEIVQAPKKEKGNHKLVGKCSVAGTQHTYNVDYNGIGEPQKFNWENGLA